MEFTVTKWNVRKLLSLYKKGSINLSPAYQRNFIWSIDDQRELIDSINRQNPIPNFFILQLDKAKYEMVDGQQRSRTILGFVTKKFTDKSNNDYNAKDFPLLLSYVFPVTIIHDLKGESIEKFYALVNKTGVHLNKPEVRKADFYDTTLLKLVRDLASSKKFKGLKLFTETTLKRMNDVEFVSELIVLIKDKHVDKKGALDGYFKQDITLKESEKLWNSFNEVLDKIVVLNKMYPLNKTRYKQRNDFYTLFDFILHNPNLSDESLRLHYQVLLAIDDDIKPTQDDCVPLKEYARNCVTQSNSKQARIDRVKFFERLLLNESKNPNQVQSKIIEFYRNYDVALTSSDGYFTIQPNSILKDKNIKLNEVG